MSETKWTPGPWHVARWTPMGIEDGSKVVRDENDNGICYLTHYVANNARLIAAAPDLYEALFRLTRDCELMGLQDRAGFDVWIAQANAALLKATGEQP